MSHARRPLLLACAGAMSLVLAACGGGPTPKTAGGHSCSKADTALQCQLPPAPHGLKLTRGSTFAYGVDFAWGGPRSCSAMRQLGARFGASYFSYDSSKNWNAGLVNAFHACGLGTVGVWETSANRATQGYSAGVGDAHTAASQAAAVGNTDRPIDIAVDCDCAGASILGYFQGAHSVLGDRTNAYGGYSQVLYLSQHGVVGHENWQTYAWSGGRWLPASIAPLEQYLNGNSYDNDRAISANYGQWPAAGPPPPPPDPYAIYDRMIRSFDHGRVRANEHSTVATWDAAKCANPVKRTVCRSSRAHIVLLRARLYHVATTVPGPHPVTFGNGLPSWSVDHRGARFQGLSKRVTG